MARTRPTAQTSERTVGPRVRLRVVLPNESAIGPGKADLLAAVETLGSIAAAGRSMGMSYQRAWSLIEILNTTFLKPLVTASHGGATRGGAELTATGREVLERYRAIERKTMELCRDDLDRIGRLAKRGTSAISKRR
jgi:molybdate transport system regulatory protein